MSRRQKRDAAREAARQQRTASKERLTTTPVGEIPTVGGFEVRTTSDVRLLEKAIKKGWNIPAAVFDAAPMAMAHLVANKQNSPRTRISATRALATMHGQNLSGSNATQESTSQQINVAVGVNVQVKESDDWYGTQPAAIPDSVVAESNGAPTANPLVSGPIQGGSVRPAVGQNGVGTNGHSQGPRSLPGPA
jgi:hypothetical protein